MINKTTCGGYWIRAAGITVFFSKVRERRLYGAGYELIDNSGAVVAVLFSHRRGFKARVGELKEIGLIK